MPAGRHFAISERFCGTNAIDIDNGFGWGPGRWNVRSMRALGGVQKTYVMGKWSFSVASCTYTRSSSSVE